MSVWAYFKNIPTLTKGLLIISVKKLYMYEIEKKLFANQFISSFWLI